MNDKLSLPLGSAHSRARQWMKASLRRMTSWACPRRAKNKKPVVDRVKHERGNRTVSGASEVRTRKSLSDVRERKVTQLCAAQTWQNEEIQLRVFFYIYTYIYILRNAADRCKISTRLKREHRLYWRWNSLKTALLNLVFSCNAQPTVLPA